MYFFIVNPNSASGRCGRSWNELELKLKASGVDYTVCKTKGEGHAIELAAEICRTADPEADRLIVMSGDGCLNEVLTGIDLSGVPVMSLIPSGSGNDFARGLKIPSSRTVDPGTLSGTGAYRWIDLGQADFIDKDSRKHISRRFGVSAGIGYDAQVCVEILRNPLKSICNKLRIGKLVYTLIGVRCAFTYRKVSGTLTVDDDSIIPLKQLAFISFQNLPYEGGGWPFAPDAGPDDGLMDLCIIDPPNRLSFAAALIYLKLTGKHARIKGVRQIRCRKAVLHLDTELPVHSDGEVLGSTTDLELVLLPQALRLTV